ncbi:interleukin 17-like protein [Ruditapes philippinarum]|uniref:interleukin 17-like protein n=1 Tax=Ruditapes philippinarum TaxID=129788 RepID=UPI00295AFD89|nr:interleukin 17-like protein [Ruditapes philippinarum]
MKRSLFKSLVLALAGTGIVFAECIEPENAEEIKLNLQKIIKDTYLNYMSFFNIKSNLDRVKSQLNDTDNSTITTDFNHRRSQTYISRLYGEPKCKSRLRFRAHENHSSNEISSCPWYHIIEFDSDRIPLTLLKARCTCVNCLVPMRNGYRRDRNATSGSCKEVSYHMPVIRRHCVGGEFQYRIAIENIPVGCTCQRCNRNKKQGKTTAQI